MKIFSPKKRPNVSTYNAPRVRARAFSNLLSTRRNVNLVEKELNSSFKSISQSEGMVEMDRAKMAEVGPRLDGAKIQHKAAVRIFHFSKIISKIKVGKRFAFESERGNKHEGVLLAFNAKELSLILNEKGKVVKYRIDRVKRVLK